MVEGETKVVCQMFDWYANDNVGMASISKRLNERGVHKVPRPT